MAPVEESLALTVRGLMAVPDTSFCDPGLVTETVLEIVQVNEADPVKPALSVALTVTEHEHAVVGVPVMAPLVALTDRPAGRPLAVQEEIVAVDDESWAELERVLMAVPDRFDWAPGLVTDTVLSTVQVNDVLSLNASESVAVTVTEHEHAVVGVPPMTPDPELMERPAGRPVAAKVTALPPVVS
ncbi:MAG: hypothetical protein WBD95_01185 [Xanthobacteraceae bacterium]